MKPLKKLYWVKRFLGIMHLASQALFLMFVVCCIIFSTVLFDALKSIQGLSLAQFHSKMAIFFMCFGVIVGIIFLLVDALNGRLCLWRICTIIVTYAAIYNLAAYGYLKYIFTGMNWMKTGLWIGIVYSILQVIGKTIDGKIIERLVENIRYGILELHKNNMEILPEKYHVNAISDEVLCISKGGVYFQWNGTELNMEELYRAILFLDGKVVDLNGHASAVSKSDTTDT
jgi:hypothetical protein